MKYAVMTFGCRVNQADSLAAEERLLASGARPAAPEQADVVLVNTCSVTASADQAARQAIRRISRINANARIVVTGCYATRRPGELAELAGVEHVVDNGAKESAVPLMLRAGRDAEPLLSTAERFGDGDGECGATLGPGIAGRTAFTLRVQTGCAESCSYCIIPTTRGAPQSVAVDRVVAELRRVVAAGFKEVAITGVHLGSYGRDLVPATSLDALLASLEGALAGDDVVLRVSSLEPMDCTPDVVGRVARSAVFAPHFHLPLQHASDRMLAAMRRPYTAQYYRELVHHIRTTIPDASIGSDLIVGFPGESDADFDELACYLETSPLTHLHVFPYSDRPGTAASALPDKIPGPVVRERARRLRDISERLARRFRAAQDGRVQRALTIDDGSVAVTGNYLKVRLPGALGRNEWIRVRVRVERDQLRGELVESDQSAIVSASV